jgi:hypothetical protein
LTEKLQRLSNFIIERKIVSDDDEVSEIVKKYGKEKKVVINSLNSVFEAINFKLPQFNKDDSTFLEDQNNQIITNPKKHLIVV